MSPISVKSVRLIVICFALFGGVVCFNATPPPEILTLMHVLTRQMTLLLFLIQSFTAVGDWQRLFSAFQFKIELRIYAITIRKDRGKILYHQVLFSQMHALYPEVSRYGFSEQLLFSERWNKDLHNPKLSVWNKSAQTRSTGSGVKYRENLSTESCISLMRNAGLMEWSLESPLNELSVAGDVFYV